MQSFSIAHAEHLVGIIGEYCIEVLAPFISVADKVITSLVPKNLQSLLPIRRSSLVSIERRHISRVGAVIKSVDLQIVLGHVVHVADRLGGLERHALLRTIEQAADHGQSHLEIAAIAIVCVMRAVDIDTVGRHDRVEDEYLLGRISLHIVEVSLSERSKFPAPLIILIRAWGPLATDARLCTDESVVSGRLSIRINRLSVLFNKVHQSVVIKRNRGNRRTVIPRDEVESGICASLCTVESDVSRGASPRGVHDRPVRHKIERGIGEVLVRVVRPLTGQIDEVRINPPVDQVRPDGIAHVEDELVVSVHSVEDVDVLDGAASKVLIHHPITHSNGVPERHRCLDFVLDLLIENSAVLHDLVADGIDLIHGFIDGQLSVSKVEVRVPRELRDLLFDETPRTVGAISKVIYRDEPGELVIGIKYATGRRQAVGYRSHLAIDIINGQLVLDRFSDVVSFCLDLSFSLALGIDKHFVINHLELGIQALIDLVDYHAPGGAVIDIQVEHGTHDRLELVEIVHVVIEPLFDAVHLVEELL